MRKLLFTLLLIIGILPLTKAQFEPGNISITAGGGIGLYGANSNDIEDTLSGVNAGSGLIELNVNYSIMDRLAVGVNFERNGFITEVDSVNSQTYGNSLNYRLDLTYRLTNSEKNSLYVRTLLGMSSFKFGDNSNSTYVKSTGFCYEFDLGVQHHFGETVGFFFNAGWAGYNYNELTDQDGVVVETSNNSAPFRVSFSGVNTRLGLLFRI